MANSFVFIELSTTSVPKAKDFYGKLFQWELQDLPQMPYTMIKAGNGPGGGMMQQLIPGAPSSWLPYVEVADIHAATQKAKDLGAKVCKDVTPVADMGWLSIMTDPTGAMLGLWQTKK